MRGLTLSSEIHNKVRYLLSHNGAAIKKGTEKLDEYILFMAHWDHLGIMKDVKDNKDFNNVSRVHYSFLQEGKLRVIKAKNRKSFFKKVLVKIKPKGIEPIR